MHFKYSALLVTMAVLAVSAVESSSQDYIGKSVSGPSAEGNGKSAQDMVFNQFLTNSEDKNDNDETTRKNTPRLSGKGATIAAKKMEMDEDENEMDENELDENENETDEKSSSNQKNSQSNHEDEDEVAKQSTKESQASSPINGATPSSSAAPAPAPASPAASSPPTANVKSAAPPSPNTTPAAPAPAPAASSSSSSAGAAAPVASNNGFSSISLESLSFPAGPSTPAAGGAAAATSAGGGKPAAATATGRGANRGLAANRRKNTATASYSVPAHFSVVSFVLVAVALF